eukprot:CAMPEP_0198125456 /NCGR_PEP_ID=MMETSP1442-20131203/42646_1 /TAXON_ID= /ORGANISM="Craspedostauros australis, Strain CCMP3328" /LENGTH=150 /DNA_ID=CAMNT_0043785053 /DNA_START=340 /DNA_END=792 /DNA_ORIENTATION=-
MAKNSSSFIGSCGGWMAVVLLFRLTTPLLIPRRPPSLPSSSSLRTAGFFDPRSPVSNVELCVEDVRMYPRAPCCEDPCSESRDMDDSRSFDEARPLNDAKEHALPAPCCDVPNGVRAIRVGGLRMVCEERCAIRSGKEWLDVDSSLFLLE